MKKVFKKFEEQVLLSVSFLFFMALIVVGLWTARELAVAISEAITISTEGEIVQSFDIKGFEELNLK